MSQLNTYAPYAAPAGRILLAILFIMAGLGKTADPAYIQVYMSSVGVPEFLFWPTVLFEVIAGALILIGYQARIVALLLAGFCVLSGLLFHIPTAEMDVQSAQNQMNHLLKNLALAGGFLMIVAHGAGALSVDNRNA